MNMNIDPKNSDVEMEKYSNLDREFEIKLKGNKTDLV